MKITSARPENPEYRIKVKGRLDQQWSGWFEGMKIEYENDSTVLAGKVADQSALYGILNRMRDLNLTLLLVEKIQ